MGKYVKILLPIVGEGVSYIPGSIVRLTDEEADELIEAEQAVLQEAIIPEGQLEIDSCGVFDVSDKETVKVNPVVALVKMHGNENHDDMYVNYYIKGSEDPFHCLDTDEYLDYFTVPEGKTFLGWSQNEKATEAENLDDFRPTHHTDLYAVFGGAEEPESDDQNQSLDNG